MESLRNAMMTPAERFEPLFFEIEAPETRFQRCSLTLVVILRPTRLCAGEGEVRPSSPRSALFGAGPDVRSDNRATPPATPRLVSVTGP
jgi:hypothetical protein